MLCLLPVLHKIQSLKSYLMMKGADTKLSAMSLSVFSNFMSVVYVNSETAEFCRI